MCGIAGFIDLAAVTPPERLGELAAGMAAALRHRGPDAEGTWTDPAAGIALAHTRLAVRDLTPTGAQPMATADGRYVLIYNGELYDVEPLRDELGARGRRFRGPSDTEVLLAACAEWGVAATLPRLNGMFAFALWDRTERTLSLARDRFGIKPLYWRLGDGLFLFGSELKALLVHPGWRREVDRDALAAFLRLSCVPAPHCIWKGARKLEPGTFLAFRPGGEPEIRRWWDMAEVAAQPRCDLPLAEAADELERLLGAAVARRLVSDVPLGAFLSGGVDSSTVVALMQKAAGRPVKTFTVGFAEAAYDESKDAAAVARHLGTEHHALTVGPRDALNVVPALAEWFDEPFADSSQIPTHLISRFARRHVTVALSGDGGDELFAGYNRHAWAAQVWPWALPAALRSLFAQGLEALPPALWDRLLPGGKVRQGGEKAHKLAAVLRRADPDGAYRCLAGQGVETAGFALEGTEPPGPAVPAVLTDPVERFQYLDTVGYLPDDILTKLDRASMAVALEARVPLLDWQVVRFAWSLPRALRRDGTGGKRVLKAVLARHVPPALWERPKAGFAVPLDAWLRGPLRDWAAALVEPRRLAVEGFLDAATIGRGWAEHQSGRANRHHALWNVLMFQAWREKWGRA